MDVDDLNRYQREMLKAVPVGRDRAMLSDEISYAAHFTNSYGRSVLKFLHKHGFIKWAPKGFTGRYKLWYKERKQGFANS